AHHDEADRVAVANLQFALSDAGRVGRYRNTCVLFAGSVKCLPSVLLSGCEDVAEVVAGAPTQRERVAYLTTAVGSMHGTGALDAEGRAALVDELSRLTDGESLRGLESLVTFSATAQHSPEDPKGLVLLHRFGDRPDYWGHLTDQL